MTDGQPRKFSFGMLGVILGFVSFAAVVALFFVGPIDPPPPVEVSIAQKAVDIRDATVAALKGEDYEPRDSSRPRTMDDYLVYTCIGLALLALLSAVIGFLRDERARPLAAAAGYRGFHQPRGLGPAGRLDEPW